MLKKFFLNMLSSFVGAWIALALFGFAVVLLLVGIAARMSNSGGEVSGVTKHSILTLDLNGVIEEAETSFTPDYTTLLHGSVNRPQTLNVLVQGIREAADNKNIDALYIKCGSLSASIATLNALREEVADFKKSGKKIFAYGDSYTTGTYYIASLADSVFLNPYGELSLKGLSSTSLYMKDLFDKLGIEFQVVKVGTFKSAVEPYIMQDMSQPARAQLDTLFGNIWGYMKERICDSRKTLTPSKIDSLINIAHIGYADVKTAQKEGLVDKLVYERVMNQKLADLIGRDVKKLNFVSPEMLASQTQWGQDYKSKNQIAVLYATGEIEDGSDNGINYQNLVPVITKLADDDNVKGMVLRVNSPGGSAFGSDQIGEALDYFKSKGKPLAVSMGDYAASGGYWISCGADVIYADPLTITGSIGIFGLIPNAKGLLDKVGVNPQSAGTDLGADFPSLYRPMNEEQLATLQKYVERGYDRFIARVAKGRHMSDASVRRIAEGRVWDAMKAQKIGLVDSLGSLQKAIEWTSAKADIANKYNVSVYPVIEPSVWDILISNSDFGSMSANIMKEDFKEFRLLYARRYLNRSRVLALMPDFKVGF